jgi:hypothetical protein
MCAEITITRTSERRATHAANDLGDGDLRCGDVSIHVRGESGVAGLKITANGVPVAWARDTIEMFAFRLRPADLWTPNYNVPMQKSLLWVYEGQTQYWGEVLAARSGLWSKQQSLGALAITAATR